MKAIFGKIKGFFKKEKNSDSKKKINIPVPAFIKKRQAKPKKESKVAVWLNNHALIMHIPLSMGLCFIVELCARHSLIDTFGFVIHHPGPFLYNSFLVFVFLSPVFLTSRRTFLRMVLSALVVTLGITNGVILLKRVTPFGFTDMYMIGDLFTMQNTNYFTAKEAALVVVLISIYVILMVVLYRKGNRYFTKKKFIPRLLFVVACFIVVMPVTWALRKTDVLASYFGNLRQGYYDYGYIYGFSTSVVDSGMSRPMGYSQEKVDEILKENDMGESTIEKDKMPNVVIVLMESFYDVSEVNYLETSEDPMPYFHQLEKEYSTGHLTVPVVGAGTCNSEFEVLTGMSCTFFGPGEYPQKTILKKTDCESVADALKDLGYGAHVVHNNGGNFYSRKNAFSRMGFDTFQSKEMLDITEYTPLGSWPTDDILIQSSLDAMATTEGPDLLYTITVQCHGEYPSEVVEKDPVIKVKCNGKDEAKTNQWSYYTNRIHEADQWINDYLTALDESGEPTMVIFFGDHLPTMGLEESEIATGDLYQTKYLVWDNFGLEREEVDMTTYSLVPYYLNKIGIHEGNVITYNQSKLSQGMSPSANEYMKGLEILQYDLLYGKKYAYHGENPYPATDIEMGIFDVTVDRVYKYNGKIHIYGDGFTKWSKVYVNGEKVSTTYESGQCLTIKSSEINNGDTLTVCQVGSGSDIFRSSNEYIFSDPNAADETETEETQE